MQNRIMIDEIIEVRVHSKFGGFEENWYVTVIFNNGKQSTYKDSFQEEAEAEAFKKGIEYGIKWNLPILHNLLRI